MADFKDRLLVEYKELHAKAEKLDECLCDGLCFDKLEANGHYDLVVAQHSAMKTYIAILELRLYKLGLGAEVIED